MVTMVRFWMMMVKNPLMVEEAVVKKFKLILVRRITTINTTTGVTTQIGSS